MTSGEDHLSAPTRSIDGEGKDEQEASENVDFAVSLLEQCMEDMSLANLNNVIYFFRQVLVQSAGSHPYHLNALHGLASALGLRFVRTTDKADAVEFLELRREMKENKANLSVIAGGDADVDINDMLDMAQTGLADLRKSISLSTLNTIVFLLEQSLVVLAPEHPKWHLALTNLGYGKFMRYYHCNSIEVFDSLISIPRSDGQIYTETEQQEIDAIQEFLAVVGARSHNTESLTSTESDGKQLSALQSRDNTAAKNDDGANAPWLFKALNSIVKFEESGNTNHLENAIRLLRVGLTEIPVSNPYYALGLSGLAGALYTRFQELYDAKDLDESISFHKRALELEIPLQPTPSSFFHGLGLALLTQFNQQGNAQDLEESISFHRDALNLSSPLDPDRSDLLNDLGAALWIRCEHHGGAEDLSESISFHRQALELRPPTHPDRSNSLSNLAAALQTRFERQGNTQDLDESISFHRQAIEITQPPHPNHAALLNNLANVLQIRFEQRGNAQDLDEATSFHRLALELTPPSDPLHSILLNNLANILQTRFEQRGDIQDLDESVSFHNEALMLRPPSHPDRPMTLNNLAIVLSARFEKRGDGRDLDESISFHRQSLEALPPSHPDRSMFFTNLAIALSSRFDKQGKAEDLDESISVHRQALELTPSSNLHHFKAINNLALGLRTRFEQRGDAHDLDESISFHRQAIDLISPSHPNRPGLLNNLASTLLIQFKHIGDSNLLDQVIASFYEAAHCLSQSSSARFNTAGTWAHFAELYQHPSAIEAFDVALGVLPELAALSLDIRSRQDSLSNGTDGIARKAAKCAIRIGDLGRAVEFLETGRSVFWSQYLSLRSPVEQLHDVAPELAADLCRISDELGKGSHRHKLTGSMNNQEKLLWEQETHRFEQLATEWKETVGQIRGLERFEDFLQPQRLSKLQAAAKGNPIIYLVANDNASNCLILTSTCAQHIPLPNLPTRILFQLVNIVRIAASEYQVPRSAIEEMAEGWTDLPNPVMGILQCWRDKGKERGMRPEGHVPNHLSSDDIFKFVLRMLWEQAVKPIVDFLGLKTSSKPPTVTWCATGLFIFLPIHAAGCYDEDIVDCASDYIISTYTLTIGGLLTPKGPPPTESFKMMVIIQPKSLPSTREELKRIEEHVGGDFLIRFGTPEVRASVEEVASRLSTASIVHFACHGKQDSANPLESGLEIEHEKLTISRIMKESVPNGSLAFLGACETAMGDEKIPDEAMNIGASLLFMGFRSVVATMWRIWDKDGPVIADTFYRELFKGPDGNPMPVPDTSKSAEALAIAVNELRTRGVPFNRWVPFIHMGK